ncbi:MAG: hypothetical protein RL563_2686 [Pseudomonadota bacterium]|jgi:hypothetical protein
MRRAARRDDNEGEIVRALRECGAQVVYIDEPCDLIVGYKGRTILVEIKDGSKPPSARKLTPNEQKFHDEWTGGELHVITSVSQALDVIVGLN